MAYYISEDGRLISFDAEIKADGSVRPRNYHDFAEGENTTPPVQDSVVSTKRNNNSPKPNRKKCKSSYLHNVQVSAIPRSKRVACKSEIMTLLAKTHMSNSAREFVRARAICLSAIQIGAKLRQKIYDASLDYEINTIIDTISRINTIIRSYFDNRQAVDNNRTLNHTQEQKDASSAIISSKDILPSQRRRVLGVKESAPQNPQYINSTIYVKNARTPKYGYARDYFGRVQERDSYREDRPVNPYSSLSNYDKEDDNESLDIL